MKRLLIILFLTISLSCGMAIAEDVELGWDANTESDLAGYNVYRSETPGGQVLGGINSPTFLDFVECRANDTSCTSYWDLLLPYNKTLYWVVTAIDDAGHESDRSNEVDYTTGTAPDPPPDDPTGCFIKTVRN